MRWVWLQSSASISRSQRRWICCSLITCVCLGVTYTSADWLCVDACAVPLASKHLSTTSNTVCTAHFPPNLVLNFSLLSLLSRLNQKKMILGLRSLHSSRSFTLLCSECLRSTQSAAQSSTPQTDPAQLLEKSNGGSTALACLCGREFS
jgi:hypothetical protein